MDRTIPAPFTKGFNFCIQTFQKRFKFKKIIESIDYDGYNDISCNTY